MHTFFTQIYSRLASLSLGLWLLGGVMLLLVTGSFLQGESSSINDGALVDWILHVPLRESWWLLGAVALLAVLAVNTLLCSIESLKLKWDKGSFFVRIAPQLMHLGFILIMIAHLQSAYGGFKQAMQVTEGSAITFPDGSAVVFTGFAANYGKMGMPTAYSASLECRFAGNVATAVISPNHPFFHLGHGIYIKDIAPPPLKAALVEVHKEPGGLMALSGGAIFTLANLVLLVRKREKIV